MDKIEKALNKLSDSEKRQIKSLLRLIQSSCFSGLASLKPLAQAGIDIKKLKGYGNIFRLCPSVALREGGLRKGKIRIIYKIENKKIFILAVERRTTNTYSHLK